MCITSLILLTTTCLVRATRNVFETFATVKLSVVMESWVSIILFLFLIMKLLPDQSVVYEYFSGSSVAVWKQWHNVLVHSIPCPNWPKTGHKYMYCLTLTEHIVSFISSDRLVSQFGKRRPLMLGGTVLLWWVVWSLLEFWFSLWTEHVFICKPLNWQQIYCLIMYVKSIKSGFVLSVQGCF